jgi:hypothetical protein
MARITGAQTRAIYKNGVAATAYGTAVAGSTGDRIRAQFTPSLSSQELTKNPIGGGLTMQDNIIAGRLTPTVSLSMDLGYRNGADQICAQFFGTSSAPAEQTGSQADYLHRLTMNSTANAIFGTLAYEVLSDKVAEYPSCAVKSITTQFGGTHEIVKFSAELLANDINFTSVTNTNASIASATEADTECVVVKYEDAFWINASSGDALDSGDQFNIVSYQRTITRPQDFSGQVKGSAGNPKPLVDEIATGTLVVTLEALEDITMFTGWSAGTFYKCLLNIEGTQIGSGDNKTWNEYTPYMKLVQAPKYDVTDSGFNTVTLNFIIMQGASSPTGMSSALPYVEITNGRTANYIA